MGFLKSLQHYFGSAFFMYGLFKKLGTGFGTTIMLYLRRTLVRSYGYAANEYSKM